MWDLQRGADRVPRDRLEGARRRDLGGARSAPALHPLEGHGLGGGRPRGADVEACRRSRARSTVAGAARRDPRRGAARRVSTPTSRPSPSTTGPTQLDASLLMIPLVGFLPADGPPGRLDRRGDRARAHRTTGSCCATARPTTARVDGLTGREGAFLACSFWLADCLAHDRADRRRPGAVRAAARPAQRPRAAVRGVRRRAEAPGRQLPAGLLPRLAGQHRLST